MEVAIFGGQQPLVLLPLLDPPFFPIIIFLSTALPTGMTGISLHMRWPLTSKVHGSILKENNCFFHALIRLGVSLPSFDTPAWNGVMWRSQQSQSSLKKYGPAEVWTRVSQLTHRRFSIFLVYVQLLSVASLPISSNYQGCQIFLGPNIPKWETYTK
jgi:hypothetical protein